jgi:tRNA A-37 threonylcarbamoyl transferase component Bud32
MAQMWRERYEDLLEVTPEFFTDFKDFIDKRHDALAGVMEIEPGLNDEIIAEVLATEEYIQKTFGDPHHFLGNGRVAEVYEIPNAPHMCVKYVKDQVAYNDDNHMRTEYGYLEDLSSFVVNGIRAPKPYFVRIHPSEGHSYGMERINGKSLSQILERPAENEELIKMLKEMDKSKVRANFESYIKTMHEQFGLTHGDLFMRNLMVDNEGNFFVIDFGKSKIEQVGEDHERRRSSDLATLNSEVSIFLRNIDKIDIN